MHCARAGGAGQQGRDEGAKNTIVIAALVLGCVLGLCLFGAVCAHRRNGAKRAAPTDALAAAHAAAKAAEIESSSLPPGTQTEVVPVGKAAVGKAVELQA